MKKKSKRITDAVEILHRHYVTTPSANKALEEARINSEIARHIYELRHRSKLTQAQLAKRVGTSTSVISRLEDADYTGHSLTMLQRIASALNQRIEFSFAPLKRAA